MRVIPYNPIFPMGRLSLSAVNPCIDYPTYASDIYYLPFHGDAISLIYKQPIYNVQIPAGLSITPLYTSYNTCTDVFCSLETETPTLKLTPWLTPTTRAIPLSIYLGFYVNNLTDNDIYLGTVYNDGAYLYDNPQQRYVWNMYNRVQRQIYITDVTHHSPPVEFEAWAGNNNNFVACVNGLGYDIGSVIYACSLISAPGGYATCYGPSPTSALMPSWYTGSPTTTIFNAFQLGAMGYQQIYANEYAPVTGAYIWSMYVYGQYPC